MPRAKTLIFAEKERWAYSQWSTDCQYFHFPRQIPPQDFPMPRLVVCLLLLVVFSVVWTVSPASQAAAPKKDKEKVEVSTDWPGWRGANRDNISHETRLNTDWEKNEPELLFQVEGLGEGYSSVSVVGDKLYTTGNGPENQEVVCVDLTKKEVLWKKAITTGNPSHGYAGARCTPSIDNGKLYAISSDGGIVCLNAEDGTQIWRKSYSDDFGSTIRPDWGFSESPLVDGDWVLCTPGAEEAMVVALDKNTGETVWKSKVPTFGPAGKDGAGYSSIVISNAQNTKQYVQLVARGLIGVRASDGELLWSYNKIANPVANIPTPLVQGNYVFGSTGYGEGGTALLKLLKKGKNFAVDEEYYRPAGELQNHHGGMILIDKFVYMGHGHNNGFPACVNLQSGKMVWGGKVRGAGSGSAALACYDDHLVFRYQSGEVALVEAKSSNYKLKGVFTPAVVQKEAWSQPVIANGVMYLREQNVLMAYDLKAK